MSLLTIYTKWCMCQINVLMVMRSWGNKSVGSCKHTSLDHQCLIFCSGWVALLPGNVALPDLKLLGQRNKYMKGLDRTGNVYSQSSPIKFLRSVFLCPLT